MRTVGRAPRLFNGLARAIIPTRLAWTIATHLEIDADVINPLDFMPYLRGLSRVEVDFFLRVLERASEHTAADVLPTIDIPTLVIGGERDTFTPPERSREMADAIPNAELVMVDGGTHTTPIERPGLVVGTIAGFLKRRLVAPTHT